MPPQPSIPGDPGCEGRETKKLEVQAHTVRRAQASRRAPELEHHMRVAHCYLHLLILLQLLFYT